MASAAVQNPGPQPLFDFTSHLALADSLSMKWRRYAGRDVIPMWVADMDFRSPPVVSAALHALAEHGHFGYITPGPAEARVVTAHLAAQYDWEVSANAIVWLPGLVLGLNLAVRTACANGAAVVSPSPVYPPFFAAPRNQGVALRRVALQQQAGRWQWDWAALENALSGAGLLLLCHPHNPVGRVWEAEELTRIAALAQAHDVVVCADEIHCGLLLDPERRHVPLLRQVPALASRCITLMAPTKTYNVPSLGCAFAVIPDAALRTRFEAAMAGLVPHVTQPGIVATLAALRDGEAWRQALLQVLRQHAQRVQDCVAELPGLSCSRPEATYLAWIDCREWAAQHGVADVAAHFEAHGLGLSDGAEFGSPGFVRLNFGCPQSTLEAGLARLRLAVAAAAKP